MHRRKNTKISDDSHQHGTVIGKPVAGEEKKELKIGLRVQGIPQTAVDLNEHRTKRINRLAHMIKIQPRETALVKNLQKTDAFNPLSEEPKRVIHNLGNVEDFELCEISSKTQRSSCSKYRAHGVVYCTFGNCLIPAENPASSQRKDHIAMHDVVRLMTSVNTIRQRWIARACSDRTGIGGEHGETGPVALSAVQPRDYCFSA